MSGIGIPEIIVIVVVLGVIGLAVIGLRLLLKLFK